MAHVEKEAKAREREATEERKRMEKTLMTKDDEARKAEQVNNKKIYQLQSEIN